MYKKAMNIFMKKITNYSHIEYINFSHCIRGKGYGFEKKKRINIICLNTGRVKQVLKPSVVY